MIPLFNDGSLVVLESLSFTQTLYAFDFDGTLSKIAASPDAARLSKKTGNLLKTLSTLAPVAVVSGRSVQDLREKLGFTPQFLVGNHGLEGFGADSETLDNARAVSGEWLRSLQAINWQPGIEIENKSFSIALHYRRSRNKRQARKSITEAVATLTPEPRLLTGKLVYNLLPSGAPHKGKAVLDLLKTSGLKHLFYIGDDETDEDVFGLPHESFQVMSVRVGSRNSSQAKYYIERQSQIDRVLQVLIDFHEDSRRSRSP